MGSTIHLKLQRAGYDGGSTTAVHVFASDSAFKGIADGDTLLVLSACGEVRMHANVSDKVKPRILSPPSKNFW